MKDDPKPTTPPPSLVTLDLLSRFFLGLLSPEEERALWESAKTTPKTKEEKR
jgi:hypothetical protein